MGRAQNNFNSRYERKSLRYLDPSKPITVAIYGRVSTEHEAQLSALENQMEWYDMQVASHPNWTVYKTYVDPGVSGTQMKKRPQFLKMLEDAKNGQFDLIFTRETCRFARNIEETLRVTRELADFNVEVYFYFEDLWTFVERDMDRLVDYARRAQEESRRTSERVLSGQEISRKRGILYGNGNILGYTRVGDTYVIDPEQAETVKMIFDLYLQGNGSVKIAKELTERKRKTSSGKVKWDATTVMRTIRNRTYAGMNCYNKSRSNNFLEQKRINNLDMTTFEYCEGNFPAIISDEVWQRAQELRESRTMVPAEPGAKKQARRNSADIWAQKLRCSCGKCFRKNVWYTYKDGTKAYGYQCYNQLNNGTKSTRQRLALDTEGFCDQKMIADWKMDLMAKTVATDLWQDRAEAVKLALDLITEFYKEEQSNGNVNFISAIRADIQKQQNRLDNLITMRADGEISREEFAKRRKAIDDELANLTKELELQLTNGEPSKGFDFDEIYATLNAMSGLCSDDIDPDLLSRLVSKVVPTSDTSYDWYLNLGKGEQAKATVSADGRKTNAVINLTDILLLSTGLEANSSPETAPKNSYQYTLQDRPLLKPDGSFLSIETTIDFDKASRFQKENGHILRKSRWQDITVRAMIDVG